MSESPSISTAVAKAWQHVYAGQLPQAEGIARQILSTHPDQPGAMHILGTIAFQVGRSDVAVQLLRRVLSLQPPTKEVLNDLGNALMQLRQFDSAITSFQQALAIAPETAAYHYNLGNAMRESGRIDEAIAAFREALVHRPAYPNALNNLGNLLMERGQIAQAMDLFRNAIEIQPDMAPAYYNLARAQNESGQTEPAIDSLRRALQINPQYAEAMNNLAVILEKREEFSEAKALLETALRLRPDWAEAHYNLGNVHRAAGEFAKAMLEYRMAQSLQPDHALAHYNLGLTLLLLGDFTSGWKEYEWRWAGPDAPKRSLPWPQWKGEALAGRKILLHVEQGFGDTLQFVGMFRLLRKPGGKIVLTCPLELGRLLANFPVIEQLITDERDLPRDIDVQCPILSLPGIVGTTLQTIPAKVPYLHADPQLSRKWREKFGSHQGVKVGVAWAGRPEHRMDKLRSISLVRLAQLTEIQNLVLVSLQKGAGAEQVDEARNQGFDLLDWTSELNDFADTAALIENLDLVICVDTAVAHLAGAMGKAVWVLLPFVPDWRWLLDRQDSPWYPSMRLFRQPTRGDWQTPIARVIKELTELLANT